MKEYTLEELKGILDMSLQRNKTLREQLHIRVRENDHTVREAEVVQVIRVVFTRGYGTSDPDSPFREVVQYRTFDGDLLVEIDPCLKPDLVGDTPCE